MLAPMWVINLPISIIIRRVCRKAYIKLNACCIRIGIVVTGLLSLTSAVFFFFRTTTASHAVWCNISLSCLKTLKSTSLGQNFQEYFHSDYCVNFEHWIFATFYCFVIFIINTIKACFKWVHSSTPLNKTWLTVNTLSTPFVQRLM